MEFGPWIGTTVVLMTESAPDCETEIRIHCIQLILKVHIIHSGQQ